MPLSEIILLSCQGVASLALLTNTPNLTIVPRACNTFFTPQVIQTTYNYYPYMSSW